MKAYWMDTQEPISSATLKEHGIDHEVLPLSDYQPALDRIKARAGYIAQDIIELNPETPNLPAILAKFDKEHLHSDDEVRFVLDGAGIFDIRSINDRWMRIEVFAGDYIAVPANRHHRFFCTDARHIRCVRLFKDNTGWTPIYRNQPAIASLN